MRKDNAKVADIMSNLVYEIELDERKYRGQSILNIVENMKHDCIDKVVSDFCRTWYASKEDVMYAALHYRNGEIPNESVIQINDRLYDVQRGAGKSCSGNLNIMHNA